MNGTPLKLILAPSTCWESSQNILCDTLVQSRHKRQVTTFNQSINQQAYINVPRVSRPSTNWGHLKMKINLIHSFLIIYSSDYIAVNT